ncbi:hypothetical protein LEN26_016281 [Aphanomyces euteiches]|nr:hypothetical protein LEN26_016281 [Aphanomyces euteiches]KAH9105340.1 hypothetical protein AeMF1_018791 [Aphanomyces euteiches]KAH9192121.1 hypothetical protein AeNC1_005909 [Aphanomyces euteiches]
MRCLLFFLVGLSTVAATTMAAAAANATKKYYIRYENGIEVEVFYDRRRLDAIESINKTLNQANSIVLAVMSMGDSLKKNIDTVLADLATIQSSGLTLDNGNKTLQDAQAVIQNGLLLTTQVQTLLSSSSESMWTPVKGDDPNNLVSDTLATKRALDSLIQDVSSIGTQGLSVAAAAKVISDLQTAIQTGLVAAKDGVDIMNSIQQVVTTGVSIKDGQVIASTIQNVLQKGLAVFDMKPKVCRRQASFRGGASPLVNLCLPSEDTLGPLCIPKCRTGYEPSGFDSCRKIGCSGAVGVSDLGDWCTKPPAYSRPAYAVWSENKCKTEQQGSCDKCALMWFPKCKAGFHDIGCFVCTPDCPAGTKDDVAFCRKDSYFRGISATRLGCPAGKEQSLLLCYPPCGSNQDGLGPLCSPKCSGDTSVTCGIFCTSSAATCASSVVEIAGTGVHMALSAIASDFTGVLTSAVALGTQYVTMSRC